MTTTATVHSPARRCRRSWRTSSGVGLGILLMLLSAPVAGASPGSSDRVPPAEGPVVVTMEVVDETFRVLTHPDDVATAWALLAGEEAPSIPNGRIMYGDPGVNAPWSWQLDPDDFEWAEVTTEVCDGKPSDVETHLITSDRYCPWLAPVLAVVPASPDGSAMPSGTTSPSPVPVAGFRVFRDAMAPAWALLDTLRPAIEDPQGGDVERIAQDAPEVADALETALDSLLPDICYLDAWRLQWPVVTDLRLVADLWSAGQPLYAEKAAERLAADLATADEARTTIGCD